MDNLKRSINSNFLSNNDVILLLQNYCTPTSRTEFYTNLKAATTYLSANLVFDIGMDDFASFYKEIDMYVKRFKYAYTFLLDYTLSKHEIPYTNVKSKDIMTLRYLFLCRLAKTFTSYLYGKMHQRLSRFKTIEDLIKSTEKAIHALYKQYCKRHGVNSTN